MANIKIKVPYFVWRDGRPRWVPGPKLRDMGWRGRDLKNDAGEWLPLSEAIDAARALNAEVQGKLDNPKPKEQAIPRGRRVVDLLDAFINSPEFKNGRGGKSVTPKTRYDYAMKADAIRWKPQTQAERSSKAPREDEVFGQAHVTHIGKPDVVRFYSYLLEKRGHNMARGIIAVLSAAWTWGTMSPDWYLGDNPCHKLRLPKPEARVVIWTDAEIRALDAAATALNMPSIGDAVYLALFTGQRRGDILSLMDADTEGKSLSQRARSGEAIRFKQSKTGAKVSIFPTPQLIARLIQIEQRQQHTMAAQKVTSIHAANQTRNVILHDRTGAPYNEHTFSHVFADARALAIIGSKEHGLAPCPSLEGKRFQDLRDTAVTWLARAGCTIPEIASMSGHSLASIHGIMKHYLELGEPIAKEASMKLQSWLNKEKMSF